MKIYNHSKYSYITIIQISKSELNNIDFAIGEQPRETLEHFYARQETKPTVLINAELFNMTDGATIFTVMNENVIESYTQWLQDGYGIIGDSTLQYGSLTELKKKDCRDFFVGYPVLVEHGSAIHSTIGQELNYNAKRTAMGDNDTDIYILLVDAPGCKFDVLSDIFLELKCTNAINLDGGGSSRCLVNGKKVFGASYSRPVDSVLAFFLKSTNTKLYRVQAGAFSIKNNALQYQQTIRNIEDNIGAGYKSAYVVYVNGLYKVQIGAFSKRENAEKVLTDLKSHGFNAFITQ